MNGTAANSPSAGSQPVTARARLRPKSQLTLPEEIKRALRVNEGDEVEFRVNENGTITVRGYTSIPTDHPWLYAAQQNALQTSGRQPPNGSAAAHESADAPFRHPHAPEVTDV
jgi:bifunctional DNA-binding transcriptional regulator/antitoxin component of YhaV-PrlF toxin-antitoxin module